MPSAFELAQAIAPELVALRRDFHQHPEIAWQEVRTGEKVAEYCRQLGLTVFRCAKTGVVATLNAEKSGSGIALRADMDALPIQEENEVPYKSTVPDVAHLCGHDAHTTMLLGAAKVLAALKSRIPFPVRFIFQPAEEAPPCGAPEIIKAGGLDGVDEIFGLHVNSRLPLGSIGVRVGPVMASMDKITIEIEGRGGHGAMPHLALDPVPVSAEIISALQTIVSRRVDPLESAVVSICVLEAGSVFNVIPSRVKLIGTARSLTSDIREKLPQWIEEIAGGIAKAHGLCAKTDYFHGTPVLVNHADAVGRLDRALRAIGGTPRGIQPTMGGEDFAYYLEKVPGCFAFIGASDGTPDTSRSLHNPRFNIDEKVLPWGVATFVQLVADRANM